MSLGLLIAIFIVGFIVFAMVVSKLGPAIDERGEAEVEQEILGIGDQQKAEKPEERGTSLMG